MFDNPLPNIACKLGVIDLTLNQVEEKPDVTYNDVGGCKEQIEKLKEVVEMPLLHVSHMTLVAATPT